MLVRAHQPGHLFKTVPGYPVYTPKTLAVFVSTQSASFKNYQSSWISARALQTAVGAENGAQPLKPRLPRALCGLFAGMDDRKQFHKRVFFRSCSRARSRAASAAARNIISSHAEPRQILSQESRAFRGVLVRMGPRLVNGSWREVAF